MKAVQNNFIYINNGLYIYIYVCVYIIESDFGKNLKVKELGADHEFMRQPTPTLDNSDELSGGPISAPSKGNN